MGLVMHADEGYRLNSLNSVRVPAGVDEARIRQKLLHQFNIEIGGGLGPLKGKIWRIGLMGESSSESNILLILYALEKVLPGEGYKYDLAAGVDAAIDVFKKSPE
jgi:alanine-glyoxylate transaminase/serine-glyoxylate transaminase/serine-pyruvate transaminase